MPTYMECPSCRRKLRVPDSLQAGQVKCPSCFTTFEASEAPPVPLEQQPAPDAPPPPSPFLESVPSAPAPDRPTPAFDEDGPFPRGPRRDSEPHRANLILTLGVTSLVLGSLGFSLVCCGGFLFGIPGLIVGLPAAFMGAADLRKMSTEAMDPSGRGTTQSGMVCGIIGASLSGLMVLFTLAYVAIIFVSSN